MIGARDICRDVLSEQNKPVYHIAYFGGKIKERKMFESGLKTNSLFLRLVSLNMAEKLRQSSRTLLVCEQHHIPP